MSTAARQVTIGCTMLLGTNKKGVLTPDADGYYTVPLGAYGAYNSANMFYDLQSAIPFFQEGSVLNRMITKGVLRGEYRHPQQDKGMSDAEYVQRIRRIDEDRVCIHIRRVYLQEGHKDDKGRPVVAVIGEIRPSGPFGDVVKAALENPHENVYFSVRSLTVDDMMRGIKYTREIITWDYVNEGGMFTANKYQSPSLETFDEVSVTPTILWGLMDQQRKEKANGLESNHADYENLAADLGWNFSAKPKDKPVYLNNW